MSTYGIGSGPGSAEIVDVKSGTGSDPFFVDHLNSIREVSNLSCAMWLSLSRTGIHQVLPQLCAVRQPFEHKIETVHRFQFSKNSSLI